MWQFDPKKGPLYLQLAEQVVHKILAEKLKPGDKLPSSRDLALSAGLNPNTVIQAFQELEKRAITETRRGKGTFVREAINIEQLRQAHLVQITQSYLKEVAAIGLESEDAIQLIKELPL